MNWNPTLPLFPWIFGEVENSFWINPYNQRYKTTTSLTCVAIFTIGCITDLDINAWTIGTIQRKRVFFSMEEEA